MFRLTCIELDNGEFAVYINHHYLGSEDASGERLSLGEILEQLSLLPGVELQTLHEPVPEEEDWCWNDIADRVLPSRPACRDDVTVAGLIARLKQYPPDALCLGTFWLEDDFLSLDGNLSEEEIAEAMRICDQSTEIVKLLRIQASDTHVVEFDNVDTRFNDCNNWQVMAGGKRVLFSNRMYERFSEVKSGIVATINVCENSGSVTDKAMLEGAKVMMQVLDGYPSFAALAAHPKRITG